MGELVAVDRVGDADTIGVAAEVAADLAPVSVRKELTVHATVVDGAAVVAVAGGGKVTVWREPLEGVLPATSGGGLVDLVLPGCGDVTSLHERHRDSAWLTLEEAVVAAAAGEDWAARRHGVQTLGGDARKLRFVRVEDAQRFVMLGRMCGDVHQQVVDLESVGAVRGARAASA